MFWLVLVCSNVIKVAGILQAYVNLVLHSFNRNFVTFSALNLEIVHYNLHQKQ